MRDVLVLPKGVEEWDGRGIIGCSSFRRRIQAKRLFKEAEFRSVRGNVITRLEKLDRGEYDALILAAAGLKRLGLEYRISRYFSTDEILPAAGQGTMAVQGRIDMNYDFLEGYGKKEDAYIAKGVKGFCPVSGRWLFLASCSLWGSDRWPALDERPLLYGRDRELCHRFEKRPGRRSREDRKGSWLSAWKQNMGILI